MADIAQIEDVEHGARLLIEHEPRPVGHPEGHDTYLRRFTVQPFSADGKDIALNVGVYIEEKGKPKRDALGVNLDRNEVILLRDVCEAFLDPGATEREFEALRKRLEQMDKRDEKL